MGVNVINPNKGIVYLSKEGLQLDGVDLDKFHPNSNVNTLQVNIEDGGVLNTMAMINYQTPSMAGQSQAITSHWYPMYLIGINNAKVANESGFRTFAQFLTPIPVNILNLNLGRSTPMNVKATVKLVGGVNFKGVFDSLEELQEKLPPTSDLDEEYAIACVIDESGNVDYYQVDETSPNDYEWVKHDETTNPILSLLESKQYNIFNISVQGGFGNAKPLPLATQHFQILWQAINNQGIQISDLNNKVDNVISSYQNTIQSVSETPTIKPTITSDLPNGKRLDLDVKISVENDLIEVESDGLKVTNEKVDERIDLKTNPIIQDLNEHIEDLNNPHGVTAEQVGTYNKTTIDNKDANTLQQAKDYTYSKVEIDNKDTAIMNKANNLENANMFKDVSYNNVNGVLTFTRYDDTTKEIDLPLELIVTSGYYDEGTNELVLVLANGSEIRIPVGDLLTDLDAHNIRFNGSGTNYLVSKTDVESAVKELDTRVKGANDDIALKVNTSDIVDNLNSTDTDKPLSANQGKVLKDAVDLLDTRVDTLEISKYNFVSFDEGMGEFNIDKDCQYDTIYLNLQSGIEGTFPDGYWDGGFLIQTQDTGNEYPIQTLFSPLQGKIYAREVIDYGDEPVWGEWKEFYGERSAFVQYQSNSGWAKIAQIRLPANNSQRESITFLVTAEDNTSTTAERYTGILELNTHENASSSSLKWLVVSGFGLNNFNLRLNGNKLEVWVLPTIGTMSFAVLSETMSGKDVRFIELFDVSEPATRTGTSLGNSEKLTIMTNEEIKAAYEANSNTNAYTDEDKAKVDLIKTNGDGSRYLADDGEYHKIDMNAMAYFNYASRIYDDKYNLLASAWEHSLTVNPSEISVNSSTSTTRGKAQYPNGEIEGVIIPHGVTRIGNNAFYIWSANNQPLVIPNSVTSIGNGAFYSWTSNNQPLVIPEGVVSIGTDAFRRWTSNNQPLVIPHGVTSIGAYAFENWTSNNKPLVIPDSVTSIGSYAFSSWFSVPYVEMKGTTPPTLANANAFSNQNNAPIYVPDESVEAYKTAPNWSNLADRIFSIKDK